MPLTRSAQTTCALAAALVLITACGGGEPAEEPEPSSIPTAAPSPSPSTPTPEPTPEPLGISGTYSGRLAIITYEGWWDEPEAGDPQKGDWINATVTIHEGCDFEGQGCSFEYAGFDPDDPADEVFEVEDAEVTVEGINVTITASVEIEWECWDENGYVGDVSGPLNYSLFTSRQSVRTPSMRITYEVPPATPDDCGGHTVTSGSLDIE